MFEEYVFGSYMSYERNPNYWGKTTIDGKTYQLPFIDRVVIPIISDHSTELAALKTGKIDVNMYTRVSEWDMLDKEASSMAVYNYSGTASSGAVYFRCDEPPFNNVKVRQALTIGTDIEAFKKASLATGSPTLWLPILPGDPAYVPLEQMPKDIQDLYTYNPTLAKQKLAEAGFPEGTLKTTLYCDTTASVLDEAALLKSQWQKIGVEVTIKAAESAETYKMMLPVPKPTFHGLCRDSFPPSANPMVFFDQVYKTTGGLNYGQYSNAEVDALLAKVLQEASVDERTRMLKQVALIGLREAYGIPLHLDLGRVYAWPWVKNYYGELSLQDDCDFSAIVKYIWIDRDLKAKMGYK
jgi:peptide/nickel transport system substrate-binding protein